MNGISWVLLSVSFCAIMNIITKHKLMGANALYSSAIQSLVAGSAAVVFIHLASKNGHTLNFPTSPQVKYLILCGILAFGASATFFTAYESGGQLFFITTAAVLIPLIAAGLDCLITGIKPNIGQLTAWTLAALSVIILTISSQK